MNETIAREQMAKLVTRHLEQGGTTNRRDFAEWMLEASGYSVRNDRERKAFETAAMLAIGAYKVWQAAKPTSTRYAAPAAPVAAAGPEKAAAVRKPRARKTATTVASPATTGPATAKPTAARKPRAKKAAA